MQAVSPGRAIWPSCAGDRPAPRDRAPARRRVGVTRLIARDTTGRWLPVPPCASCPASHADRIPDAALAIPRAAPVQITSESVQIYRRDDGAERVCVAPERSQQAPSRPRPARHRAGGHRLPMTAGSAAKVPAGADLCRRPKASCPRSLTTTRIRPNALADVRRRGWKGVDGVRCAAGVASVMSASSARHRRCHRSRRDLGVRSRSRRIGDAPARVGRRPGCRCRGPAGDA